MKRSANSFDNEWDPAIKKNCSERMDNQFKGSCIKNAVSTITTNLTIDIEKFTKLIGGQLTTKLPGTRIVLVINEQRYSVICFRTGSFLLTNLFFFNRLKEIYDFFLNFGIMLIKRGIATLHHIEDNDTLMKNYKRLNHFDKKSDEDDSKRRPPETKFYIRFLVENVIFSFRIKNEAFQQRYSRITNSMGYHLTQNALVYDRPPKEALVELLTKIVTALEQQGHIVLSKNCQELGAQDKTEAFPADIIKLSIERDGRILKDYKSNASTKRNKYNFNRQNISILIFNNAKIIITGMQIRSDLSPMFNSMHSIVQFFLPPT